MLRPAVAFGLSAALLADPGIGPLSHIGSSRTRAFEFEAGLDSQETGSRPSFAEWLEGIRTEALARGIRREIVDQAIGGIDEPLGVVVERDRRQAETVQSLERYVARRVTPTAIRNARLMLERHHDLLKRVVDEYGVPASVIVSIWGLESNFGRFVGVRPTVAALATLAWDGRRTFFRNELFDALTILDRGDIEFEQLRGSWAGAMGQPQFMPSSYLRYAVDFDGDGRRDIWHSPADIFASVANYLKGYGWVAGESWGREVVISAAVNRRIATDVERRSGTCQAKNDMTVTLPVEEWRRLGVRSRTGGVLPSGDPDGALVSGTSKRYLVHENYDALLAYNCAHSYAVSVALLADRLGS